MGRTTTLLTGTMIFWLPALFFSTYIGLYEAYQGAMNADLLGLNYSSEFATMLIIPAMLPTIFTAHTILNREKMTQRLIEKLNRFHSLAGDGISDELNESLLTIQEYEKLDFTKKIEYCENLGNVGRNMLSNKLLIQFYAKYIRSSKPVERAAALYSRVLISDRSVNKKEMFESSEMAFNLIVQHPSSDLYNIIVFSHITELTYLGYEAGLRRMREIEKIVSDSYVLVLIEIRKLLLLYRMGKVSEIDFQSLETKIDFQRLDQSALDKLEKEISNLKNETLLDREEFEELELYLHQRFYRYKWAGKDTVILQNNLGRMYGKMGEYERSLQCFNVNLTKGRTKNLPYVEAAALVNIGKTNYSMGNYEAAKTFGEQSLQIFTGIDLARGLIESLALKVKASQALNEDCDQELEHLKELEKEHGISAKNY
jgi:tetratricopeptide (TPR) repeat protein